ncbi:MAG: hypothetical protein LBD24_03630 [Spirochaetaceae bacterium]|jgi:hypothetical protein|nr:hypothetical protein [Spirochaetaceae bacterium]
MDISINEKPADITLESEKTVGELLSGIEQWLQGSEHRISGLRIDGETVSTLALSDAFARRLDTIQNINITVSAWQDLALEALLNIREDLLSYDQSAFDQQTRFKDTWETDVTARFLAEHLPDIFAVVHKTLAGSGPAPADAGRIVDERIRELMDPSSELTAMCGPVSDIAARLEDLPLDIQTGKDSKVVETIQLFSHTTDKLFRLIRFLRLRGRGFEAISIDSLPLDTFIEEFGAALKELLEAYETQDAVLVGDLAEYELAPRFLKLYSALNEGRMT